MLNVAFGLFIGGILLSALLTRQDAMSAARERVQAVCPGAQTSHAARGTHFIEGELGTHAAFSFDVHGCDGMSHTTIVCASSWPWVCDPVSEDHRTIGAGSGSGRFSEPE